MRQREQLIAGAIILASAAAFGVAMAPILRGEHRPLPTTDADLAADPFKEWFSFVLSWGLIGLSIDASARWVSHYSATGEMMSMEQIERSYE